MLHLAGSPLDQCPDCLSALDRRHRGDVCRTIAALRSRGVVASAAINLARNIAQALIDASLPTWDEVRAVARQSLAHHYDTPTHGQPPGEREHILAWHRQAWIGLAADVTEAWIDDAHRERLRQGGEHAYAIQQLLFWLFDVSPILRVGCYVLERDGREVTRGRLPAVLDRLYDEVRSDPRGLAVLHPYGVDIDCEDGLTDEERGDVEATWDAAAKDTDADERHADAVNYRAIARARGVSLDALKLEHG